MNLKMLNDHALTELADQRFVELDEDETLSRDGQRRLLSEAGLRSDRDDPETDVDNDLVN